MNGSSEAADTDERDDSSASGDSDHEGQVQGQTNKSDEQGAAAPDLPDDSEEIEAEREKRLDPDNRDENTEVDNTDRDFDSTTGQFTDHEPDPEIGPFPAIGGADKDEGEVAEAGDDEQGDEDGEEHGDESREK